jgi:hypothetical protein
MSNHESLRDQIVASSADPQRRTVVHGTVITMDPARGDFPRADILIEGTTITAISEDLEVADGSALVVDGEGFVAIPGLHDTHRHSWQSAFRRMFVDIGLEEYVNTLHGRLAPCYSPEENLADGPAPLAGGDQRVHVGATEADASCSECDRLDDVGAPPDAAVEQHFGLRTDRLDDPWQRLERGDRPVQSVAAMVGHDDRVGADIDCAPSILDRSTPLITIGRSQISLIQARSSHRNASPKSSPLASAIGIGEPPGHIAIGIVIGTRPRMKWTIQAGRMIICGANRIASANAPLRRSRIRSGRTGVCPTGESTTSTRPAQPARRARSDPADSRRPAAGTSRRRMADRSPERSPAGQPRSRTSLMTALGRRRRA